MRYSQFLIPILFLFSCSSNRQTDSNVIIKELHLSDTYFIGKRSLDNKANIYTREIVTHTFSSDTIRKYILNNWQNIEYWDGDGGYLLFKDFNKIDQDGYKLKIDQISLLSDEYLSKVEKDQLDKKRSEEIEMEKTHFRLANASSNVIQDYLNGNWYIDANLYLDHGIYDKCLYTLAIQGNNIRINCRNYTNYENKDNAPDKVIYNGTFTTRLSSAPIMWNSSTKIGDDDILYLDLSGTSDNSDLSSLSLYLKQEQSKIDAKDLHKVYFIGLKARQESFAHKK